MSLKIKHTILTLEVERAVNIPNMNTPRMGPLVIPMIPSKAGIRSPNCDIRKLEAMTTIPKKNAGVK